MRFIVLLLLFGKLPAAAEDAGLRASLEAHRWFDLRDAVTSREAPPLFRFFVSAAFNDARGAERDLKAVVRSGATRKQLTDAHYALKHLYYRNGQYRKASAEMRRVVELASDWVPSEAEKANMEAVGRLPDLEVVSRRPATITTTNWQGSETVVVPLRVNGRAAQFGLDTDASMSVMTEAEAKRLGMRMVEGQPQFFGPSGENSSSGRYAVAERLSIGNTEMRNAAFLVLPDGLEVFEAIPLGQQGAVGLPVMMALETIRWNRGHELSTGFPAGRADVRTANLSFEENDPLTTMEVDGRRLTLDIDTGCRRSDLWPKFAEEFPAIIRTARQGTEHFVGATGGTTMDAAFLPELRMKVAGFPIVFPDVPVLKAVTVPASKWHYGWLCMDILAKAAEVTLDFRAMRIQLK